jgi:predicted DNA-binding protein
MEFKKEIRDKRIAVRISSDSKRVFKILADKKGKSISLYLSEIIEKEIELSGISKYEVSPNQIEMGL